MEFVLELRDVSKHYPTHRAVHAISLSLARGEFFSLLGPSGCGKTTTLRLIAGYIAPDAGTIEVAGELMSSPAMVVPPQARGMGMVFQNYAVWPHKTVFQNVVFGLRLRKLPRAQARRKVEEMLALVNLDGLGSRYPSELSGGQQQRVALARSLVVEPGILLLDEPLSNLDAKLRERMRGELKELQRRTGITFVYVTHDQAEALALSDRVAVMSGGRLQQYGTPSEVYVRPANRMVADFMGLVSLLPGRVRDMKSGIANIELTPELMVAVPSSDLLAVGGRVEVVVRPENIRLLPPQGAVASALGKVTGHVFLGNLSEYQVVLSWGPALRVQTHPLQKLAVGDEVAIEIDGAHSSAFPRFGGGPGPE